MIFTSSAQKVIYRENLRRYFDTQEPDCIIYLYNVVCMLASQKESIDKIRKTLGDDEYYRIQESLKKFQPHYSYAAQVRKIIADVKAKQLEDKPNALLELQRRELASICKVMPILRSDIITFFFLLVNDSDLRNIVEPASDKSMALRPYTPYHQAGDRT